jgi:hypothetical protein
VNTTSSSGRLGNALFNTNRSVNTAFKDSIVRVLCPPGSKEKLEKRFNATNIVEYDPNTKFLPEEWNNAIDYHHVLGADYLSEILVYHKPSQLLVITDLSQNLAESDFHPEGLGALHPARLYKRLVGMEFGEPGVPLSYKFIVDDKTKFKQSIEELRNKFEVDGFIFAHGSTVKSKSLIQKWHDRWLEVLV